MKLNIKDNKTKLILFFMITGWLRILILVIPSVWIYMNTGEWREQSINQEQVITETNDNQEKSINKLNDYLPTLKME